MPRHELLGFALIALGLLFLTNIISLASTTVGVTVVNFAVSASASPSSGPAPLTTTLSATVSGGTAPYSYSWSIPGGTPSSSTSQSVSVTYSTPGTYTATVTVRDAQGIQDSASVTITVTSSTLTLTCSAQPNIGKAPLPITLTCNASGGTPYYSWSVDWGDGSSKFSTVTYGSTLVQPHTFNAAGKYTVTISVTAGTSSGGGCLAVTTCLSTTATLTVGLTGEQTTSQSFKMGTILGLGLILLGTFILIRGRRGA
jgi:PKD repeat protein